MLVGDALDSDFEAMSWVSVEWRRFLKILRPMPCFSLRLDNIVVIDHELNVLLYLCGKSLWIWIQQFDFIPRFSFLL